MMFYRELAQLAAEGYIEREIVIKFDHWLSSLPDDFTGELKPQDFAQASQVDYRKVVSLFNKACERDILKIDFKQICPVCGVCMDGVCQKEHGGCCRCEAAGERRARKVRFSYRLNRQSLLPN